MPNFTLATWIKHERDNGNGIQLFCINDEPAGYTCCAIVVNDSSVCYGYHGQKGSELSASTDSNKQWSYLEISFEGTKLRIFKNGKLVKTGTITRSFQNFYNVYTWIGQWPWTPRFSNNGSTFYFYDFCLLEGVLHTENYEPPKGFLTLDGGGILNHGCD